MKKECSHGAFTGVGIRSLLTLNDACGDADSTQLYYQCSKCFAEFVTTINTLTMETIKPMKQIEKEEFV